MNEFEHLFVWEKIDQHKQGRQDIEQSDQENDYHIISSCSTLMIAFVDRYDQVQQRMEQPSIQDKE